MAQQNSDREPNLVRLVGIMQALRDPETGCPWDKQQTFATIAPYTIEEAYEVEDAISRDAMSDLKEELGDLLFQVIFHAQLATEAGHFTLADIIDTLCDKMTRRHPHVFGDQQTSSAEDVKQSWEEIKSQERAQKQDDDRPQSLLDDIPLALPALSRAVKLQKRAARVGFDWPSVEPVFEKLTEEIDELREVIDGDNDEASLTDELGDVFFVVANLARKLGIDPETALRSTNQKFSKRFNWMEQNADLNNLSLDSQEELWQAAKTAERNK